MPKIDEPTTPRPKAAPGSRKPKAKSAPASPAAGLISLTLDVEHGRIIAIERIEAEGARRALTETEKAQLARVDSATALQRLVERAFEAGIETILGSDHGREPAESEEAQLSGMLLKSLIDDSSARELISSKTFDREIIGSLIARAAEPVR